MEQSCYEEVEDTQLLCGASRLHGGKQGLADCTADLQQLCFTPFPAELLYTAGFCSLNNLKRDQCHLVVEPGAILRRYEYKKQQKQQHTSRQARYSTGLTVPGALLRTNYVKNAHKNNWI